MEYQKEEMREVMPNDYCYDQEHARSADECLQDLRGDWNDIVDVLAAEREKVRVLRDALAEAVYRMEILQEKTGYPTAVPVIEAREALAATEDKA